MKKYFNELRKSWQIYVFALPSVYDLITSYLNVDDNYKLPPYLAIFILILAFIYANYDIYRKTELKITLLNKKLQLVSQLTPEYNLVKIECNKFIDKLVHPYLENNDLPYENKANLVPGNSILAEQIASYVNLGNYHYNEKVSAFNNKLEAFRKKSHHLNKLLTEGIYFINLVLKLNNKSDKNIKIKIRSSDVDFITKPTLPKPPEIDAYYPDSIIYSPHFNTLPEVSLPLEGKLNIEKGYVYFDPIKDLNADEELYLPQYEYETGIFFTTDKASITINIEILSTFQTSKVEIIELVDLNESVHARLIDFLETDE